MNKSDFVLFLLFLTAMLILAGCTAVGQIDTNGYTTKLPREHTKYCQQTVGRVTTFVPCSDIKHDEEI